MNCPSVESGPIRSYADDFSKNRDQMIGEKSVGRNTENSAATFEGGSGDSTTISAEYLGLVKTSNIAY